jgi:hypothetical protein
MRDSTSNGPVKVDLVDPGKDQSTDGQMVLLACGSLFV